MAKVCKSSRTHTHIHNSNYKLLQWITWRLASQVQKWTGTNFLLIPKTYKSISWMQNCNTKQINTNLCSSYCFMCWCHFENVVLSKLQMPHTCTDNGFPLGGAVITGWTSCSLPLSLYLQDLRSHITTCNLERTVGSNGVKRQGSRGFKFLSKVCPKMMESWQKKSQREKIYFNCFLSDNPSCTDVCVCSLPWRRKSIWFKWL